MPSITTVPRNLAASFLVAFVCVLIAACGGGGGGSGSAPLSPPGASWNPRHLYRRSIAQRPQLHGAQCPVWLKRN
jgi:hypothetical protein